MKFRPTYLIMVTAENNNKYYNCFPQGDIFTVEYGRVDATKSTATYPMSKWDSQITSKLKKGYKDVTDLKSSLVEELSIANPTATLKEIEIKSIREIINHLCAIARETVVKNYSVNSSAVTQEMVEGAQNQLNLLSKATSISNFNEILLRLFVIIPRKMTCVGDYLAKDREQFEKIISKEQDLLDVMRGQIYVPSETTETEEEKANPTHTILDEMGITMEEASADDIKIIKEAMKESAGKFRRAWKVTNKNTQQQFDKFVKENNIKRTKLLFHGSRSENWFSIMKTGLMIRPSNATYTGSMYGDALYFAPKCQKSIGYTSLSGSYWANGSNNVAYMAMFDTAYGTPYDVYSFSSQYYNFNYTRLQQSKPGANCLHAHADKGMLRNDEIVFYKKEQATIKYLIEIGN